MGNLLLVRHGHAWGGRELIASLATNLACNDLGSAEIGRRVEPTTSQVTPASNSSSSGVPTNSALVSVIMLSRTWV